MQDANRHNTGKHREPLRQVIDHLPTMIAYVDKTQTYRVINRAYHDYFGASENEVTGKHASEVLGENFYRIVKKYIDSALAGNRVSWETHHTHPVSGEERILSVRLIPYKEADGSYNGYLVVIDDVDEFRRLQRHLEQLNRSLESEVQRRTAQLEAELQHRKLLEKELRVLADRDSLTGLLNRRAFVERLETELDRARRHGTELTYMIIDLDKFKQINDTWGHQTGDAVLRAFAQKIKTLLRSSDIVGRIGGEEFAIVLPETGLRAANEMGQRICKEMAEHAIQYRNTQLNYTVSIGISRLSEHSCDAQSLYSLADNALYQAKNNGRNQVVVAMA